LVARLQQRGMVLGLGRHRLNNSTEVSRGLVVSSCSCLLQRAGAGCWLSLAGLTPVSVIGCAWLLVQLAGGCMACRRWPVRALSSACTVPFRSQLRPPRVVCYGLCSVFSRGDTFAPDFFNASASCSVPSCFLLHQLPQPGMLCIVPVQAAAAAMSNKYASINGTRPLVTDISSASRSKLAVCFRLEPVVLLLLSARTVAAA